MKRIFLSVLILIVMVSCSEKEQLGTTFITNPDFTKAFTQDQWRISNYKVNGKSMKAEFQDYIFTFSSANELVGSSKSDTIKGKWHVESDPATDDSPDVDFGFKIQFPRKEPFKYINGKWAIVTREAGRLSLLSYTSDDWEYLTFEKVTTNGN
ncbi:hypothetical protein [Flavobacterium silvaticum]|uniref:Lipocalin-like domain-containing protein n=1 Tax=Flavobacterium silvaticum TaxID=1852020 RepID=A0A972JGX8_9FLAO|nr:hypothetical protein [Flavobacterium silvaticum]NMH28661.1 hypothetical protein [Flavobacterium silvaticum]